MCRYEGLETHLRHDLLPQIRIRIPPRRSVLHHLVCSGRLEHGDHKGLGGQRDDDGAGQAEGARGVHCCETGVAAAGGEDMRLHGVIAGEFFEAAENIVSDSSADC